MHWSIIQNLLDYREYKHLTYKSMPQRRMFSSRIIGSARFMKMPISSQALYFHLCLNADDDGVVEAYKIIKTVGCNEDDLKVICAKGLVKILNEDLVTYILDWREHNFIRADRKIDSIYKDLLLKIVPEADLVVPKPRSDVRDNSKRLYGQSMDSLGKGSLDKYNNTKHPSEMSELELRRAVQ